MITSVFSISPHGISVLDDSEKRILLWFRLLLVVQSPYGVRIAFEGRSHDLSRPINA